MNTLDPEHMRKFLELAGDRLTGDWVVIGGCVPHLLGFGERTTADIDVAGPDDAGMDQTITLMEIAEELGLPVEAINQAGSFFLRRIDDWKTNLIEVHRGKTAAIHVPDTTLFVLLKLNRLTEADLADCRLMIAHARDQDEVIDTVRVRVAAQGILDGDCSAGRRNRVADLLSALDV